MRSTIRKTNVLERSTPGRLLGALAVITLLLGACSALPAAEATPSPTAPPTAQPTPTPTTVPTEAPAHLQPLLEHVGEVHDLTAEEITVQDSEKVEWRNSCLGAGYPGERCLQVLTTGYRVVLDTPSGTLEYHTDESGERFRLVSSPSGIEGRAVAGPTCPVEVEGTECPDQPVQITLTLSNAEGQLVAEFQTDEKGQFRIPAAPGTYTLATLDQGSLPMTAAQEVRVSPGEYTEVLLELDTGIR